MAADTVFSGGGRKHRGVKTHYVSKLGAGTYVIPRTPATRDEDAALNATPKNREHQGRHSAAFPASLTSLPAAEPFRFILGVPHFSLKG